MVAPSSFNRSLLLLLPFFLLLSSYTGAERIQGLVLPITKDPVTMQYITRIHHRTPSVPLDLVIDLGGRYLWVDCDTRYTSCTYRPAGCRTSPCSLAGSNSCGDCFSTLRPGCNNNTCGVFPENPFTHTSTSGELAVDGLALNSTDGFTPSCSVTDPSFLFSCAPTYLASGLAAGSSGIAGLGRNRVALPSQLAARFSFRARFAICLSATPHATGVLFFGLVPYHFLPGIDVTQFLSYTPLLTNSVSTAGTSGAREPSYEYFIGVTAIKVGETAVAIDKTLLTIKKTGEGGTKISTTVPYTALETTIYNAVTAAFAYSLANVTKAPPVAPFNLCYDAKSLRSTRVGPAVPAVDLVLHKEDVYWRIFGANSMVEAKDGVLCFAFVDGGIKAKTSIVIGAFQLENNLVEMDLWYSRVGFSSTLLFRQTTCSNFNFTTSG